MNVILQGWTELPVATRLLAVRAGGSLVSASKASPALLPALAPLLDSCQAVAGSGPPDLALPALETLLVAVEELPLEELLEKEEALDLDSEAPFLSYHPLR